MINIVGEDDILFDSVMLHAQAKPALVVVFVIASVILLFAIPYFLKQSRVYGSMFNFASSVRKWSAGISALLVLGIGFYFLTPYVEPPSDEIAIVIGNTQNTPAPSLNGEISDTIVATMLAHKGSESSEIADSIKFVSAIKQPAVISLKSLGVEVRQISNNSSNAKRDARINIEALTSKLNGLAPVDSGANYLEAIVTASRNVKPGSKIIVVGSGLSDSGHLNFSKTSILTNEEARAQALSALREVYKGGDVLEDFTVEFHGLGDTTAPQEALSSLQKGIVEDIYKEAIRNLGGRAIVNTRTQVGASVATKYEVGTTDTGCGDINLIFDENDIKFVGDKAVFIDKAAATKALSTIKVIWDKQRDTIQSIQVDGYTAHYPGAGILSQDRANTVKDALVALGVSSDKITASGKGYGPYDTDPKNRVVKVNISRDNNQCSN